jgi:dUTP pyrophosphatase
MKLVKEKETVKVKKLFEDAIVPTLGSIDAAGWDLYAYVPEGEIVINPHMTCKVSTGIAMAIPTGYWGGIYARSGMATKNGLAPANKTGVIDSDYRGPIIVALHNHSNEPKTISHGERIAQFVLHEVFPLNFEEVDNLDETMRGEGGFGSTGTK